MGTEVASARAGQRGRVLMSQNPTDLVGERKK
jgi:hypothetical protein